MSGKSPDAYRTISEAGEEAGLPSHVLRFWESKFSQLRPVKRAGGRRSYRPQDISFIKGLKRLLYEEGYTIKGAQKYLREHGVAAVSALADGAPAHVAPEPARAADRPGTPAQADQNDEVAGLLFKAPQPVPGARDESNTPPAGVPAGLSRPQRSQAEHALERVTAARARLSQALSGSS